MVKFETLGILLTWCFSCLIAVTYAIDTNINTIPILMICIIGYILIALLGEFVK